MHVSLHCCNGMKPWYIWLLLQCPEMASDQVDRTASVPAWSSALAVTVLTSHESALQTPAVRAPARQLDGADRTKPSLQAGSQVLPDASGLVVQLPGPELCWGRVVAASVHGSGRQTPTVRVPRLQLDGADKVKPCGQVGWQMLPDASGLVQSPGPELPWGRAVMASSHGSGVHVLPTRVPFVRQVTGVALYPVGHVMWHVPPRERYLGQSPLSDGDTTPVVSQ